MNPLLEVLNRLLAEALADPASQGAVQVRSVLLDAEGARIEAQLRPPAGEGELVLRLRVESPQGEAQTLLLTLERGPERWAPALEPFRRMLERSRLRLELDFSEPAEVAPAEPSRPAAP